MNNEAIEKLLTTKPALRGAREKLESMRDGAYCLHGSWGFGQIIRYDEDTNRLIIDFPESGKPGHPMAPEFCVDKLEILPDENILVRAKKEPKEIGELIAKNPAQLIKEILGTDEKQSMSGTELEITLTRLLGEKYKKWWTTAKKILAKDPDVSVPAKKDGYYVLRDEPKQQEEEILDEYYMNKNPKKKILLAEKLFESSLRELEKNDGDRKNRAEKVKFIEEDLHKIFDELTGAIQSAKKLSDAEQLHGIWVRNDLCRHLKEDVDSLEPTSKSIIMRCDDAGTLSELAEEIPQSPAYLKRILDLLTRVFPDPEKWQKISIELLKNSSGKFTAECVNFLVERDCEKLVVDSLLEWLTAQALKGPVLSWIIKNRNSKKYSGIVKPLLNSRLLAAILYAIDTEALMATTNRRIHLAEELSSDRKLIPDLLENATYEEARDLGQSLMLNQGFEPLTKNSILARFIELYPDIASLVSNDAIIATSESLVVSQWSFDRFKAELEDIVKVKLPENKEAINRAKEHGDLKENSEYKMARQDQETLLARKGQLETDLARARITDFSESTNDTVSIGTVVDVENGTGGVKRYTILGAWDSDPDKNILSYKTPLAKKLIGKKVGNTVETEVEGNVESWTIRAIARWKTE